MRALLLILFMLNVVSIRCIATRITPLDREILKSFWIYATEKELAEKTIDQRIPIIGEFFINTPYKSNTLNVNAKEKLVVNLRELDCVTLVDNVLALALLDEYNNNAIHSFMNNIIKLRYRDSKIVDYTSRLHYSTDWLYEMGKQHILKDITSSIGGTVCDSKIYFMSENHTKYPALVANKELLHKIKNIETEVNKRTYYYIPKEKIDSLADSIQGGDIILITTHIKGMDTSHLGIAVKKEGKIHLLHASSDSKKVVMTTTTLAEYMAGIKSQSGIIVGRIIDRQ